MWSAKQWAIKLLDRLAEINWGFPRAIISDRDRKFVAELWKQIFVALKVDLLYSTAYHPQTDGTSERTNQTVEIALRYYIAVLKDPKTWPTILPRMSAVLNNSTKYSFTNQSPNQVIYGFRTREALDLLRIEDPNANLSPSARPGNSIEARPPRAASLPAGMTATAFPAPALTKNAARNDVVDDRRRRLPSSRVIIPLHQEDPSRPQKNPSDDTVSTTQASMPVPEIRLRGRPRRNPPASNQEISSRQKVPTSVIRKRSSSASIISKAVVMENTGRLTLTSKTLLLLPL